MKFLENLCIAYSRNSKLYGYNIRQILNHSTLYIAPMINPDGVNLVNGKINTIIGSMKPQNTLLFTTSSANVPKDAMNG